MARTSRQPANARRSTRCGDPRLAAHGPLAMMPPVLFADLRKFTTLAERRLPYDVVSFLNRYFEAMGRAIESAGGITNQFTGDGVMALFGVDADPGDGCRRARPSARSVTRSACRPRRWMPGHRDRA